MRPRKVVALVIGALMALVALGLFAGGAVLLWAHGTQRDADGYYTAPTERFETPTVAITSAEVDLGTDQGEGEWNPVDDVGTVRVRAERVDEGAVFLGIAPAADIERYLADSAHDELVDVTYDPFVARYETRPGEQRPDRPSTESFWVASAEGSGRQTLTWELDEGEWGVVVMNADASPGVAVDASAGISTGWLLPIGAGLLAAGAVALAVAVASIVYGARDRGGRDGPDDLGGTAVTGSQVPAAGAVPSTREQVHAASYPLQLTGHLDHDGAVSRWLWLVKWFLAIPHLLVLALLWPAMAVLTFVAGVAILVTGRYPRGLFTFNVGVLRWTWRVTFYAFTLGTDRYPPFTLGPDPTYPAQLGVRYPESLSRPLVLVKWWLLALPHYLIISIFGGGVTWWTWAAIGDDTGGGPFTAGGLIGLLALVAGVVMLVTGRYPRTVFDLVVGLQRWTYRVLAYAGLMTDEYPPFRLDSGGTEASGAVDAPPSPDRGPQLTSA